MKIKTLLLTSTALVMFSPSAFAVCPSTFQIKDNLAATGNVVYSDSSGNCIPNVTVNGSTLPTGAATSSNQATEITSLSTIATNTGAAVPAGTNLIGNVGQIYPAGSTPITAAATGTTTATTATLGASSTLHTYICGFSIRANATAAASSMSSLTGVVTGTMSFLQWTAPAASGIGVTEEVFSPCIISSAINTAIAVVSAAPGTGGLVSVDAWGYQL
jgi:hypothetical protein